MRFLRYAQLIINRKFFYPSVILLVWCGTSLHWLSGNSFIPWDSVDYCFPQVSFVVSSLLRGESPAWNPLLYGGAPAFADPQGMIFTPHVLTGLISGSAFGLWIFDATTLTCMLAGALCLYGYARSHGSAAAFAALGATVFLLGGYGTSRLQHVTQIISYALLPILLLTFGKFLRKPSVLNVLALSFTGALLALNPNQVVFLTPFLLGPLLFLDLLRNPIRYAHWFGLAVSVFLVVLVAAPSLSAMLEIVAYSTRADINLQTDIVGALPSFSIISLFIPGLFFDRLGAEGYWGPIDATESYLYIGVIPAIVVFVGMARRESLPTVLVVSLLMGILSFLYAMGSHGPIFPWLFENIYGFSLFRRPSDSAYFLILYFALVVAFIGIPGSRRARSIPERILLPALALAFLAYTGFALFNYAVQMDRIDALARAAVEYSIRFGVSASVIALICFLSPHKHRKNILLVAIISLTAIDLTSAGRRSIFAGKYSDNGIASMYRVLDVWRDSLGGEAVSFRDLAAVNPQNSRVEVFGGYNLPMALGVPMTQGYNPLKLKRYKEVFGAQILGAEPKRFSELAPSIDSEAYRWLGLRFLLLHGYILDHPEGFGEVGKSAVELRDAALAVGGRQIDTRGTYRIIEMHDFYPRAGIIPDGEDITGYPKHRCQIISETNTRGSYYCDSPVSGKVVIGDSFAPGWMACVDGRVVPVEPFLHALRSVSIPAGKSFVELRYHPVPFLRRFERCANQIDKAIPVKEIKFKDLLDPISFNEKLSFDSSARGMYYLQTGWSDPEDWGTWSDSRSATVFLKASPAQVDSVVIDFAAAVSPSHPVQRVDILVNGSQAFSGSISERSGTIEFKIPDAAKSDSFKGITMEFRLPDAASPKEMGTGEDTRTLALGLRTITLTEDFWAQMEPVSPGEKLSFGSSAKGVHYLQAGWSNPEDWGTWSDSRSATILLPTSPAQVDSVVMDFAAAVSPSHPVQRVDILVNGSQAFSGSISERSGTLEFKIPEAAKSDSFKGITMEFRLPDAASPKEMGIGNDERILALGLRTITLTEDFLAQMEPVSPGEKLGFGSSAKGVHYLQAGWSAPEDWGTWSASRSATVFLKASPAQVDSVVIDFSAAVSPSHPVQRVEILVNGSQAFSGSISERSGTLEFKIPEAAKSDSFKGIKMEFRLPDAASPKEMGTGEDTRTLALGLRTITLTEDFLEKMEPVSPGEKLGFGSSAKGVDYLQAGWSAPEDWGTWSDSRSATILLPTSPAQVDSVAIDFAAAVSPSHPVQRVEILVNGSQAFSGSISERFGTLEFKIPEAAKSDSFKGITMEFRLPDAASPKEMGTGEDTRTLALGLQAITLAGR